MLNADEIVKNKIGVNFYENDFGFSWVECFSSWAEWLNFINEFFLIFSVYFTALDNFWSVKTYSDVWKYSVNTVLQNDQRLSVKKKKR